MISELEVVNIRPIGQVQHGWCAGGRQRRDAVGFDDCSDNVGDMAFPIDTTEQPKTTAARAPVSTRAVPRKLWAPFAGHGP